MPVDTLADKLGRNESALGVYVNDVYNVDLVAEMGFNWFGIDQMFTPHDWTATDRLLRAGWSAGITPVVRIQSNPWLGYDHRISVDVSRALGIGAQYILVSNSCKREIEECAQVSRDWHRKAMWVSRFQAIDEWESGIEDMWRNAFIIPQAESEGALKDLLDTLDIPEVRIVFIAMTDAAMVLSGRSKPDFHHPALWELLDAVVAKARDLGKFVGANVSYAYSLGEWSERAAKLHEHGVRMILLQTLGILTQVSLRGFMTEVKASTGAVADTGVAV